MSTKNLPELRRKSLKKEISYGFSHGSGDLTFGWEYGYLGGKFWWFLGLK